MGLPSLCGVHVVVGADLICTARRSCMEKVAELLRKKLHVDVVIA